MLGTGVFAIALAIGFFALANQNFTGFFGLPKAAESALTEPSLPENSGKPPESAGLGAELSISVLKESRLSAEIFIEEKIPGCPETTDANILVKNIGGEKIEALKIRASPQLGILACADCIIDSLGIGESKTVFLRLCNASDEGTGIIVSSANTGQVEIKIESK